MSAHRLSRALTSPVVSPTAFRSTSRKNRRAVWRFLLIGSVIVFFAALLYGAELWMAALAAVLGDVKPLGEGHGHHVAQVAVALLVPAQQHQMPRRAVEGGAGFYPGVSAALILNP